MDAKRKAIGLVSRSGGGIDNTWCSASLDDSMPCMVAIDKRNKGQAYQDKLGYWWCEQHKDRGWLLDWGMTHGYPTIRFSADDGQPFAIGDKKDPGMWKLAVLLGQSKAMNAAVKYLRSGVEQEAM